MRFVTYIFPILLLFFTACGGGNSDNQTQKENTSTDTQASARKSSDDVRTIEIIGIDKMKYVVKEEGKMIGTTETVETADGESYLLLQHINAKAGEEIRIHLTTKSKIPASAMSHNWILLEMDTDLTAFTNAASGAKANDYIPSNLTDQIIAHTGLAGGGETAEVTFTVPEKTGDYNYLCSFPGHFAGGMKGLLKVE